MRVHSVHQLIEHRRSISTKVFNARGSKVLRCQYCQVELRYCICDYQPDEKTDVAALIILSESEILKPSNTGRLIADVIKDTYSFQWHRTEPDEEMLQILANPAYFPIVVFPEEYVEQGRELISERTMVEPKDKKRLFIFIDSNWREAKKIFRKSVYLQSLPVLSIRPSKISQYIMRQSINENHLSTAEVASIVLEQANENNAAEKLTLWFELFRESYLLSKTRMKKDLSRPALMRYLQAGELSKQNMV